MKRRDIVIGIVLLVLLTGFIYVRQKSMQDEKIVVPETLSSEQIFEEKFNLQLPEDADKSELKAIGDTDGSGIAIRKFEENKFTHSVLVDLADPDQGYFYQGWLVKGEEGKDGYEVVSTGKLSLAKGGWMLDYTSSSDLSSYNRVIVSLEKVFDNTIESKVLEGDF